MQNDVTICPNESIGRNYKRTGGQRAKPGNSRFDNS